MGRYQETQQRLRQQQDRLAQLHAPWLSGRYALLQGQVASYLGDWDEAARYARSIVEVAAPEHDHLTLDPLNTAFAMGWLGYAYLEHGDLASAMPALEQAVQSMSQFSYRRLEGLYTTLLGALHLRRGDLAMARRPALRGLSCAHETPYRAGTAWEQRTLGCIAAAAGALEEAAAHLTEALTTFAAMPAHFEVGRTHLSLAELDSAVISATCSCSISPRHMPCAWPGTHRSMRSARRSRPALSG